MIDTRSLETSAKLDAIRESGSDAFHLIRHSSLGLVAIEIANQQPEVIKSLHQTELPLTCQLPTLPQQAMPCG